MKTWSCSWN